MSKILFSSLVVCLSMSLGCGGCRDGASPSVSPECGDGMCNGDETVECCPEDCPWFSCGNGVCEAGEVSDCPQDCTAGGCGNGVCEANEDPASCAEDCPGSHKVDVLFVIDNSLGAEWNLGAVLHNLYGPFLEGSDGRLPDLHIGFVSTDLGAGSYDTIRGCEEVGGDRGVLGRMGSEDLGELCSGTSDRYVVDLEPQGCFIERDGDGGCLSHGCTQQECTALEDGPVSLTLYENENGCPRCRNSGSATDVYLTCRGGPTRWAGPARDDHLAGRMTAAAWGGSDDGGRLGRLVVEAHLVLFSRLDQGLEHREISLGDEKAPFAKKAADLLVHFSWLGFIFCLFVGSR